MSWEDEIYKSRRKDGSLAKSNSINSRSRTIRRDVSKRESNASIWTILVASVIVGGTMWMQRKEEKIKEPFVFLSNIRKSFFGLFSKGKKATAKERISDWKKKKPAAMAAEAALARATNTGEEAGSQGVSAHKKKKKKGKKGKGKGKGKR